MSLITPKNDSSKTKNHSKNPFFQTHGTSTFFGSAQSSSFFQPSISSQNQTSGNQGIATEEDLVGLDGFQSNPTSHQQPENDAPLVPYSFKKTGGGNSNTPPAPLASPIIMNGGKSKPNHPPTSDEQGSETDAVDNNATPDSAKEMDASGGDNGANGGGSSGEDSGTDGGNNSGTDNASEDTSNTDNTPTSSSKSRGGSTGNGSTNDDSDSSNEENTSEEASTTTNEAESTPMATGIIATFLRENAAAFITKGQEKITELSTYKKEKKSATTKIEESNKAIAPTANEGQAIANRQLVDQMETHPKPQTNPEKAQSQFQQALYKHLPTKLGEVIDFKKNKKAGQMTKVVHNVIKVDKDNVLSTYKPLQEKANPVPVVNNSIPIPQIEKSKDMAPMNLGDGMIATLAPEHTDFSTYQSQVEETLEAEGLTKEHMDMIDEGELLTVKTNQEEIIATSKNASSLIHTTHSTTINDMNQQLTAEESNKKAAMEQSRQKGLSEARGLQEQAKTRFELRRSAVNDTINHIYEQTQTNIKTKLTHLEKEAFSKFEQAQTKATQKFENNVDKRIKAFKKERYSILAPHKLTGDLFLGLDRFPEVQQIIETEKVVYINHINKTVHDINKNNEATIKQCRDMIDVAQQNIQAYINQLPVTLQNQTAALQASIQDKLDALDEEINQKEADLKTDLEKQKEDAIQAINERVKALKEKMKSHLSKIKAALADAAVKFLRWALKKLGVKDPERIINTLKKVGQALKKIIKNPGEFFKNLGKAIGGGFRQFKENLQENVLDSVGGWLTTQLGVEGFKFPQKFDLKGIFQMVLSFFGISWNSIKGMFGKALGPKLMKTIEGGVSLVKGLIQDGPAHLQDMGEEKLKEKMGEEIGQDKMNHITSIVQLIQDIQTNGLSALWAFFQNNGGGLKEKLSGKVTEIKKTVVKEIKSWAITKFIKEGIKKIASFLNPITGIIETIKSIYKTIKFFLDNREGLKNLVKSIMNALGKVVNGDVAGASGDIFSAIMQTIKLLLDFFAKLLNLNKIFDVIKDAIKKVVKVVNGFIQTIVDWIAKIITDLIDRLKAWFKKLKDKVMGNKEEDKNPDYSPEKQAKVDEGVVKIEELTEIYQEPDNTISQENAERVVQETKAAPEGQIFSSLNVTDEKNKQNWDFVFTASPSTYLGGRRKKEQKDDSKEEIRKSVQYRLEKKQSILEITTEIWNQESPESIEKIAKEILKLNESANISDINQEIAAGNAIQILIPEEMIWPPVGISDEKLTKDNLESKLTDLVLLWESEADRALEMFRSSMAYKNVSPNNYGLFKVIINTSILAFQLGSGPNVRLLGSYVGSLIGQLIGELEKSSSSNLRNDLYLIENTTDSIESIKDQFLVRISKMVSDFEINMETKSDTALIEAKINLDEYNDVFRSTFINYDSILEQKLYEEYINSMPDGKIVIFFEKPVKNPKLTKTIFSGTYNDQKIAERFNRLHTGRIPLHEINVPKLIQLPKPGYNEHTYFSLELSKDNKLISRNASAEEVLYNWNPNADSKAAGKFTTSEDIAIPIIKKME